MLGKPGINGLRAGSTMYGMLSSARFTTTAAGASKVILIDGESAFDEVVVRGAVRRACVFNSIFWVSAHRIGVATCV